MAVDMAAVAAGMAVEVVRTAMAGMALVAGGVALALAGMEMASTGTAVTRMVEVVAGIMVVTVAVGESARK